MNASVAEVATLREVLRLLKEDHIKLLKRVEYIEHGLDQHLPLWQFPTK